jgi:hypothetical protein
VLYKRDERFVLSCEGIGWAAISKVKIGDEKQLLIGLNTLVNTHRHDFSLLGTQWRGTRGMDAIDG